MPQENENIPRYFAEDSMGRIHICEDVERLLAGASDVVMSYSQIWVSSFFEEYGEIDTWDDVFEIEYEDSCTSAGGWSDPVDGVILRCEKLGAEELKVTLVEPHPDGN